MDISPGLRELGWIEGQNIAIEYRWAAGREDQLPALAAELVRLKVDVIVTSSTLAAQAAKRATTTIPIVVTFVADPVEGGLVASLARPGGNITGLTTLAAGLVAKRLELLKAVVSRSTRMAVLWQPGALAERADARHGGGQTAETAALGVQTAMRRASGGREDFEDSRSPRRELHVSGGLLVLPGPVRLRRVAAAVDAAMLSPAGGVSVAGRRRSARGPHVLIAANFPDM